MTNEEFLRDVCPNHTDKSQWNKSELLHILELHKEQLRLHIVSQQSELLIGLLIIAIDEHLPELHPIRHSSTYKQLKANL